MKKALLIDGHNILFKYFLGMPRVFTSVDGRAVHGAYGMIGALLKTIQRFQPERVVVCFDTAVPSERVELLSTYKANRPQFFAEGENPFEQIDIVYDSLRYLSLSYLSIEGVEADDLIGSYARLLERDYEVIILSADRDYLQLVNERISLCVQRGKNETLFTPELVKEQFGVEPDQFVDYKALIGDSSDNIKGVPGIGPKTAAQLLQQYGSLEQVYLRLAELKPKMAATLQEYEQRLQINRRIVAIQDQYPVDQLLLTELDSQKILHLSVRQVFIQLGVFQEKIVAQKMVVKDPVEEGK
ncbi:5'-3' exonuclease [Tengunoibacter tsumagoiensis]|uniref:5'-3' exonuclease n=1 Tax=Tengunoibacter tsumagoiensis TaxID=2014871 RepID=UPI001386A4CD|nr:5'-3' exonuclease [Tengunoibacter tsumagoiensis]